MATETFVSSENVPAFFPADGRALTLYPAGGLDIAPVREVLETGFALDAQAALPEAGRIGTGPDAPEGLVVYLSAAETLCRAMQQGVAPSAALEDWRGQARDILALNRRDRRRMRLLEAGMIGRHPAAFLGLFGLPERVETIAALSGFAAGSADEIMLLLAQRTLLGDRQARALMAELDAASPDLSGAAAAAEGDPDAAFRAYQDIQHARLETELLQAQQRAMHEEMEALYNDKVQLEQRLEQTGQGMESYQVQVRELRAEQAGLKQKMAGKEQVIQTTGAMIRDLEAGAARLEDALSAARAAEAGKQRHAEALEAQIAQILASKSFRLMSPLRRMRSLIGGKGRA